jgi:excisionase family DNA binding protein
VREDLLTVEEVANWLRVNPQTVRHWIDRGELHALHVGVRTVRVRQSDLDRFLEAGATGADYPEAQPADPGEQGNPEPALWTQLGSALAESSFALAEADHVEFVQALNSLADAARALADALRDGPDGLRSPP